MTKRAHTPQPPASKPAEPPSGTPGRSGRVNFDEKGRAVWEWAVRTGMFDRNASTQRIRALTEAPVKLELEQTLGALDRRGAAAKPARKPAPSFNPYEPVRARATPKEPTGTDPYSRGPARRPETVTFNPYERRPNRKD